MVLMRWWRRGSARQRLRRRLLVLSAPVVALVAVAIVKALSMVIAGNIAASAYADRNSDDLRTAVQWLTALDVVEPAKSHFAAGNLAVLDNRLEEAEQQFGESLARTEAVESCPVRVNLELVRETLGDRAAAKLDGRTAIARYRSARWVVEQAPQGCFAGNNDADPLRRSLREDTLRRLDGKIAAAQAAPPPPVPPPDAPPGTPPPGQSGAVAGDDDTQLRLHPQIGNPLDRLQQILRDAAEREGGG
jgi:hypothetical protein